jgi:UDP-glucuronate 4-epimerase
MDFIKAIENTLEISAVKEMLPMQPGDVVRTWANVDELIQDFDYRPNTPIEQGVKLFVDWYRNFYKV